MLIKPWIRLALQAWMTQQRPIDAVPWGSDDPQEDEIGLARLTINTNMAAHRKLLEAFEASRYRIPAGQLVVLSYEALIRQPLVAVKRIYDELGLSSWPVAQAPVQARIAQAHRYIADPVMLPLAAEQRLNDLMEEA